MTRPLGALRNLFANAGPPVSYAPKGGGLGLSGMLSGTSSGREQMLGQYGSLGTLFAIVNRTSSAVAAVDWHMHQVPQRRSTSVTCGVCDAPGVLLLDGHPALERWESPNPHVSGDEFREASQQHVDLVGESEWLVVRAGKNGPPLELWVVRPDRMEPKPDRDKFLAGWTYHGPDGEKVSLDVGQVIQIKMPNPLDPYRGLGPVQAMLVDIDAAKYSAQWNLNFFRNSAEPGGIIEYETALNDTDYNRLRARWNEQHKGVGNAHRVAILERGKWVDRKYTMKDMQFAELRDVSRDVLRESFGMPKGMLGIVEDVNRANMEAGEVLMGRYLTLPRLKRMCGALNRRLLPMYNDTAVGKAFAFTSPVPDDREADDRERESKANAASTLILAGGNPDDVLPAVGLPPMRFSKPTAKPPAEPAARLPARTPTAAGDRLYHAWHRDNQHAATCELCVSAAVPDWAAAVQADWTAAVDRFVRSWADRIAPAARRALRRDVRDAVSAQDPSGLVALAVPLPGAADELGEAMTDLSRVAAQRVVDEAADAGVTTPLGIADAAPLLLVASAVVVLLGAGMALSAGREALRLWVPDRSDADDLAERVNTFMAEQSTDGVRVAVGGALTRAQNAGRIATLAVAPAVPRVRFYASEVLDKSTCKPCKNIDGEELPSIDAALLAYGGNGGYLGCLGRERCRGMMRAIWDNEVDQ